MVSPYFQIKKQCLRILASFTLFCFSSSTAFSAPVLFPPHNISGTHPLSKIALPENLGHIEEIFLPAGIDKKTPYLIYLQDAHANLGAQENIAQIVRQLADSLDIKTVFSEGGSGEANLAPLRSFQNQKIKEEVTKFWLEQAVLTGIEREAIVGKKNFRFFGIEDPSAYLEGGELFLKSHSESKKFLASISGFARRNKTLRKKYFNKALDQFETEVSKFESKHNLIALVSYMANEARNLHINRWKYLEIEKCIDLIIAEMEGGNIERFLEIQKSIDGARLFQEIDALKNEIKEKLFMNKREQLLDQEHVILHNLRSMASLEATPQEVAYFNRNSKLIETYLHQSKVNALALKSAKEFYRSALKRDRLMFQKMNDVFNKEQMNSAFLITGGFHSPGIAEQLRKNGIPFVLISPQISDENIFSRYFERISGKRASLEEFNNKFSKPQTSYYGAPLAVFSPGEVEVISQSLSPVQLDRRIPSKRFQPRRHLILVHALAGPVSLSFRRRSELRADAGQAKINRWQTDESFLQKKYAALYGQTFIHVSPGFKLSPEWLASIADHDKRTALASAHQTGGLEPLVTEELLKLTEMGMNGIGITLKYSHGPVQQKNGSVKILPVDYSDAIAAGKLIYLGDTDVPIYGGEAKTKVWAAPFIAQNGKSAVILALEVADITTYIYPKGEEEETRAKQMMLMGRGALVLAEELQDPDSPITQKIKSLNVLPFAEIKPAILQMNEALTVFADPQSVNDRLSNDEELSDLVYGFTTHTPVAAGLQTLPFDWAERMKINPIWREHIRRGDRMDLTTLAMVLADVRNAVSQEHGRITEQDLYPQFTGLIDGIVNGVYLPHWQLPEMADLVGEPYNEENVTHMVAAHEPAKQRLANFIEQKTGQKLDTSLFFSVEARRKAGFKAVDRFTSAMRIQSLRKEFVSSNTLQIFFGKPHISDGWGRDRIEELQALAEGKIIRIEYDHLGNRNKTEIEIDKRLIGRVLFVPDFNSEDAPIVFQGADIVNMWSRLETEASATGNMKGLANAIPTIATRTGGPLEHISDGINGFFIDGYDGDGIPTPEAIIRVLKRASDIYTISRESGRWDSGWRVMMWNALQTSPEVDIETALKKYISQLWHPAYLAKQAIQKITTEEFQNLDGSVTTQQFETLLIAAIHSTLSNQNIQSVVSRLEHVISTLSPAVLEQILRPLAQLNRQDAISRFGRPELPRVMALIGMLAPSLLESPMKTWDERILNAFQSETVKSALQSPLRVGTSSTHDAILLSRSNGSHFVMPLLFPSVSKIGFESQEIGDGKIWRKLIPAHSKLILDSRYRIFDVLKKAEYGIKYGSNDFYGIPVIPGHRDVNGIVQDGLNVQFLILEELPPEPGQESVAVLVPVGALTGAEAGRAELRQKTAVDVYQELQLLDSIYGRISPISMVSIRLQDVRDLLERGAFKEALNAISSAIDHLEGLGVAETDGVLRNLRLLENVVLQQADVSVVLRSELRTAVETIAVQPRVAFMIPSEYQRELDAVENQLKILQEKGLIENWQEWDLLRAKQSLMTKHMPRLAKLETKVLLEKINAYARYEAAIIEAKRELRQNFFNDEKKVWYQAKLRLLKGYQRAVLLLVFEGRLEVDSVVSQSLRNIENEIPQEAEKVHREIMLESELRKQIPQEPASILVPVEALAERAELRKGLVDFVTKHRKDPNVKIILLTNRAELRTEREIISALFPDLGSRIFTAYNNVYLQGPESLGFAPASVPQEHVLLARAIESQKRAQTVVLGNDERVLTKLTRNVKKMLITGETLREVFDYALQATQMSLNDWFRFADSRGVLNFTRSVMDRLQAFHVEIRRIAIAA